MTKAEINKILKFGKFKDINHFYETHPNQDDEHTQQFMSEYNAYKNGGKIGMKTGGNIKPPKKEISLSGGLFGASKFANKKGGWDSLNDPNSFMTANGKVNYFAPLNKNSNAFFKGSVGTANFLSRLEPENYLQRDNNGNLTYNVAPEGYENENDFIASARLGMQTPQKKKFNRFTDRGEISAGLDYANGNIYPGAGFNYSADYNFKRRNSLPNTQYNKTAGSVGVYGDVNIAPVGIGKEQFENYAGTDSSSEFNQAMRTNLGVKAQYNFPKNGFFVRGNAEVNPLITNFKDGIKTLPSAQLTIGQRFNNGGMMKSRLPKYNNGGWDPFNPQPLEFSSGKPNYNLISTSLTNDEVLANMAPSKPVTMDSINQSLGFYKTPGNAPVKTPGQGADFSGIANSVAQIGSGIVDSTTENDSVGGAAAKKGLNWAGTAASIALRPEVLAATGGFSALAIPVAGGIGAVLGGTDQVRENKYADFQNSADKRRRQNNLYNPNPYGMDSSYTMNAVNGGNIGPSNIKNYYADGGEMVPLNSNTEQVEGDEPQLVDGVVKRDDRTGQPIAMVDHNEVIKDGQQVFSDEKKISKKAGLTRTFAKTAEILAKQKGKLETQLEKRGGQDVYTANAIKAVDRQMNTLFGLQERTATQMGLREPAPQQAMAMRSGGNLRGYANGGQPYGVYSPEQSYIGNMMNFEFNQGSTSGKGLTNYGYNLPRGFKKDNNGLIVNKKTGAKYNGTGIFNDAPKTKEEAIARYKKEYLPEVQQYPQSQQSQVGDYIYNSGRNPDDLILNSAGLMSLDQINGTDVTPGSGLQSGSIGQQRLFAPVIAANKLNSPTNAGLQDNIAANIPEARQDIAKTTGINPLTKKRYTLDNPNPAYEATWKDRIASASNNMPNSLGYKPNFALNLDPNEIIDFNGSGTPQVYSQKAPLTLDDINKKYLGFPDNPGKTPPVTPQKPGETTTKQQKDRRAYDVDENYLLSSLGNAAQMALLGRSEVVRPVFDPNESRTANYINNMRTKMNTRDSLNQLAQQNRLDSFNASQNSPTIAAAVSATNSAAKMDAINKLNQDKFNTEVGLENQKSQMQAQNSANAGANRQAAMNKAIEETAQNKGVTNTNRMAVMAKQSENAQESRVTRQQVQNINDLLKYHNIKGGFFKFDALQENSEAVAKVYNDIFSLPAEQQPGALKTLELMSSDPNKTKKLTEEEKQKRGITQ